MEFEVDIQLLRNNKITERELRAKVFEDILKELNISFMRQFACIEDRSIRTVKRTFMDDDVTTIIYTFDCEDYKYNYAIYLFRHKLDNLEKIIKSYEK